MLSLKIEMWGVVWWWTLWLCNSRVSQPKGTLYCSSASSAWALCTLQCIWLTDFLTLAVFSISASSAFQKCWSSKCWKMMQDIPARPQSRWCFGHTWARRAEQLEVEGGRKSETSKRPLQTSLGNCKKWCTSEKHLILSLARNPWTHHPHLVAFSSLLKGCWLSHSFCRCSSSSTPLSRDFSICFSLSCSSLCLHVIPVQPHLQEQTQIPCSWWFTDLLHAQSIPVEPSVVETELLIWQPGMYRMASGRAAYPTGDILGSDFFSHPQWFYFFSGYHLYAVVFHLLSAKIPVQASGILDFSYFLLFFFLALKNTLSSNLCPARTLQWASFPLGGFGSAASTSGPLPLLCYVQKNPLPLAFKCPQYITH